MTRISLVDPQRAGGLAGARLNLHWAAQVVAAAGATLLEPEDDFGHTTLTWSAAHHALLGRALDEGGLRAGLRLADFTLLALEKDEEVSSLPLPGRGLDEALAWLGETLQLRGAETAELTRPEHDLPPHPVKTGGAFEAASPADLAQLADWFGGAHAALSRIADAREDASEVRVWPHHFDIATLITIVGAEDAESARTVGAGMTPGDGSYDVPYLYVTPWPYPDDASALPELPHGRWHTEGWTGAVLLGTDLPEEPAPVVVAFLDAAIAACEPLVRP